MKYLTIHVTIGNSVTTNVVHSQVADKQNKLTDKQIEICLSSLNHFLLSFD